MQAHGVAGDGLTAALMADPGMFKMMESFPIGRLAVVPGHAASTREQVEQLIAASNAAS